MTGVTRPRNKVALGLGLALIAAALFATPASAATTRAEYVAQVDPICQSGQAQEVVAAQPLLRAAKRAKKHPKSRKASKRLGRAVASYFQQYGAIEHAVNTQIATVPPAADDVSLIQVWLRARNELVDLETGLFSSRPKGLKGFAKLLSDFFTLAARQLEVADLVRDFGFQYCNQPPPETVIVDFTPS
jgi:hypothetical protein